MSGDYWSALSLYEEAADLGVYAAQENAAYLLEKIMPTECAKYEDCLLKEGNSGEFYNLFTDVVPSRYSKHHQYHNKCIELTFFYSKL